MKYPLDIFFYILPFAIAAIYLYFKLGRNKLHGRNLFTAGTPVKLTKRIQVESFISRDEFIQANQQVVGKAGWNKSLKWVFVFIAVMIGANFLMLPFTYSNAKIDYTTFILPLLALLYFGWVMLFYSKKSAGKMYDATEFVKNKARYVFDADYYLVDAGISKTQSGWENINSYMETDQQLLIFTGPIQALFINKSSFAPGDLDIMRQFLAANFDIKKGLYS